MTYASLPRLRTVLSGVSGAGTTQFPVRTSMSLVGGGGRLPSADGTRCATGTLAAFASALASISAFPFKSTTWQLALLMLG